jgi:hypothetical protein
LTRNSARAEARAGDARRLLRDLLVAALDMSSVPPATCSKYGFERSYMAWPAPSDGAALVGMHRGHLHVVARDLAEHGLLAAVGSAQNDAHSSTLPR